MKTAVKEVTGQDVSNLDINEKLEIYESALLFFEDPINNKDRLKQLFYSSNSKITEIENRFIKNLINNSGFETIAFLLTQLIPKTDRIEEGMGRIEKGLIKVGLQKFGLYAELPINDEYINEHVELLVMTIEAYKIIGDEVNTNRISKIIYTCLHSSKLNPRVKYIASLVLLFFYFLDEKVEIEKIIVCSNNCLKQLDKDFHPNGFSELIDRDKILMGVFVSLLAKEIARINDFNRFLKACLENNIQITNVIDNAFIIDIFNVLWSNLYKSIKSSQDIAEGLKSISSTLDESKTKIYLKFITISGLGYVILN
jgi:hypothetical protein